MLFAQQWCPTQWSYRSGRAYADPGNEVTLDAVLTAPDGSVQTVPAFWAGDQVWTVRYSAAAVGTYHFRSVCSDPDNAALHAQEGELTVAPYTGDNPLYRHGPLRVAANRRHFEHADGTPFLWLGDTWWMGFTRRLGWPEEFARLRADRVAKGFSLIQIIAGLYPDMPWPDPRGENEAGYPWSEDFSRLNPAYFDMADLRLAALVEAGLVPCVVGCWGYFLPWTGIERMQAHWRNLVARWGAYPVVWCLAGEGSMPYYLSKSPEADRDLQREGWSELGRYLRQVDPYERPITIHPSSCARDTVSDDSVLDFDMLQTGHGDRESLPNTVRVVTAEYAREPRMPVVEGEVCYEGILEQSREEVQRMMFWTCLLSGAAGFTYGANGIWQLNRPGEPFGPSPHGRTWGNRPWEEAAHLPGSGQLGLGKRFLERYPWWELAPCPELIEPGWTEENFRTGYAAGIPGKLRVCYLFPLWQQATVKGLEAGTWRAKWFCPWDGSETEIGEITPDAEGQWQAPFSPVIGDWVLVLEKSG